MRFPSINQLGIAIQSVFQRFPFPILFAVITTICGYTLSYDLKDIPLEQFFTRCIYLGNFGLALSIALCLYAETRGISKTRFTVLQAVIFGVLISLYLFLNPFKYQSDILTLVILGFAFHLLVAFVAFTAKEENNGFWQINKTFFLRFATSALYSAVLFVGLSVALGSIQLLFNINWDGRGYFRLWIVIVGLFNTTFFLAGIQKPLSELNQDQSYPKGLKVFTQYVLIPLATVYLGILLAYELKIIFQWSLPESSVAILILGYAVFGILSILLIHPLRNQEGNKWIQLFSKSFYLLLIPLLVLLAVAIIKRISDYGITESRYLLIALAIWLSFITAYFLIKGQEQIRIIPISLFVFCLLIVFGPWGMASVAKRSQTKRLAYYLAEKHSPKRNNEVRDLVGYFYRNYPEDVLQPYVKIDIKKVKEQYAKGESTKWEIDGLMRDTILRSLAIDPNYEFAKEFGVETNTVKNFKNQSEGDLDVSGAIKVIEFNSIMRSEDVNKVNFKLENTLYKLTVDDQFNLHLKGKQEVVFNADSLLSDLQKLKDLERKDKFNNDYLVESSRLMITKTIDNFRVDCRFESINGGIEKDKKSYPTYFRGYLIIYSKK